MGNGSQLALPAIKSLADLRPTIVCDTREIQPLVFPRLRCVSGSLVSGDYSLQGAEWAAAVERKGSIDELVTCCSTERERFARELQRMRSYFFRRLVVIGSRAEIESQRYRSRMAPKAVLHTLAAWEVRYDCPICYFPDVEAAALQIESWLWWMAREIVQDANELLKVSQEAAFFAFAVALLLLSDQLNPFLSAVNPSDNFYQLGLELGSLERLSEDRLFVNPAF